MSHASVSALREPAPLPPGSRVALVSPSGPLNGPHELERAVAAVESFGWVAVPGTHALARDGYLAGSDEARAADLIHALEDDDIHGIWCLRGGYGAARLMPVLDEVLTSVSANQPPKTLIGYSDITALHALWQRHGLISFHGQTARATITPFTRETLTTIVAAGRETTWQAENASVLHAGRATGRLAGGNLALVASLLGTPWSCNFDGALVVLEDVGEAVYRIDRMLTQLVLAGAFDRCAGLVLGHFTERPDDSGGARTLELVVQEVADRLKVPALLGVPIGHIEDQWTLPFGALATLDADARTLAIHRTVHLAVHRTALRT
ncbi:MAG: LD-carboxypeptidase [Gemmatimonadaceae bacterium]|nr:LD-carboxypeptidase [Gemmatimonadaceae bacterium]